MKATIHYLFLVGIPVLGILGLLRVGERITPPASVGGNWQLELTPQETGDTHWNGIFNGSGKPILTVMQSGPYVQLTFKNGEGTTLAGTLKEMTLTAASREINLEARLDRQAERDHLTGKMTSVNCSTPLFLQATRPVAMKRKEAH